MTSGAAHARELVQVFRKIEKMGGGAAESMFAPVLGTIDCVYCLLELNIDCVYVGHWNN